MKSSDQRGLIPFDVALRLAALFPFQVLQDAGVGADGKVVILPYAEGGEGGRHAEAVQVTGDVERGLYNLLRLEVVA